MTHQQQASNDKSQRAPVHERDLPSVVCAAADSAADSAAAADSEAPAAVGKANPPTNLLEQGQVWAQSLNNYNLVANQDALTREELSWERQPAQWWDTYANSYSRNISPNTVQTAYSVVEEFDEDIAGTDLAQARDYYSGPSKVLYQVTARGQSGALSTSRIRSIFARTYR